MHKKVRTYRCKIGKARNSAMTVGEGRRDNEVNEPSKDKEIILRINAGIVGGKCRIGDGISNSSELSNIAAPTSR